MKIALHLCLLFIISFGVRADVLVRAELAGDTFRWLNMESEFYNKYVKPLDGSISQLPAPTKQWLPGAPVKPISSMTLIGNGSVTSVPFTVAGVEYELGTTQVSTTVNTQNACARGYLNAKANGVIGLNCYSFRKIKMGKAAVPFVVIRPLLKIDEESIKRSMRGQLSGLYRGSVRLDYQYAWFERDRWRRTQSDENIIFELIYKPPEVTNIRVIRQDEIKTNYDFYRNQEAVSGNTKYQIVVEGQNLNSLKLELQSRFSDYMLTSTEVGAIPYSISCDECLHNLLVDEGTVVRRITTIQGSSDSQVPFTLNVFLEYADFTGLPAGRYEDTFGLLISPEL
ncbi:hypothetical protein ACPV47_18570 [Vibrio jasicida]|uniref:hypothetical protein n=1 Tax=Vibrio jasicida TaxID=766224 RepID=UPI004068B2CE